MLVGKRMEMVRLWSFGLIVLLTCTGIARGQTGGYLFEKISTAHSGIRFVNEISDSMNANSGKYIYVANSSGTGVADLNEDGKTDIFFSSNIGEYKLYLNEGNFKFKDVTGKAGVKGNGKWATGVSLTDIDGDGHLDIFVAHSGNYNDPLSLCNEAFICTGIDANGIPHYVDKAKELGLDLPGSQTSQVAFFDYDRDGDLDCFVLNHSNNAFGERLIRANFTRDTSSLFVGYNLLLRNDIVNGKQHYTNVTEQAGILSSRRNFGLGVVVTDLNNDNWPDIYTTSDFAERDHLYINNKNGTFTETGEKSFRHISQYSMGVDAADINNDLLPDLMTLDMLPDDNYHLKLQMHPDNTDQFEMMVNMGLHKQYPKNMLHLNTGNDKDVPVFAEIAQMAGVSNTNWSWTPLFMDFNNDGWKDLFISNGFFKDYTDQDVQNKFIASKGEKGAYGSKRLNSCLFINSKSLVFSKVENWKAEDPQMSYSACAADFDNDGKLDLLVNNLNDEVSLLKNTGAAGRGNYIKVKLKQEDKNTFALGAKVYVTSGGRVQMQAMENIRGYQSSQDYVLHFGIGPADEHVKIRVVWPDGTESEKTAAPNATITLTKDVNTKEPQWYDKSSKFRFKKNENFCLVPLEHVENKFNDFKVQFTLPYKQSANGPGVAEGDINGDGFKDYYIGGATGGERYFIMGQKDGYFQKYIPLLFNNEKLYEDVDAALFDIDGDSDLDLVVISGGVEFADDPEFLRDRVYRNDGKGNFEKVDNAFPQTNVSKGCVAVGDYDNDGKPDLFIGGYTTPGKFEQIPRSFVYRNQSSKGAIKFTDETNSVLPQGNVLGMVRTAEWVNMDGDKYPELMISGEWMPCKLFNNHKGVLKAEAKATGLKEAPGLYGVVYPTDYNEDGKTDFIVGNAGINAQFKATKDRPLKIFAIKDPANNIGSGFVFSYYCKDVEAFASSRNELLMEFVPYKKVFPNFSSYADVDVKGFFEKVGMPMPEPLAICTNGLSGVFINRGNNDYEFEPFPELVQTSKVSAVAQLDWNFDGKKDYLLSGNFIGYKHQFGPNDALSAYIMENQGGGSYRLVLPSESGLYIDGQVKKVYTEQVAGKYRLIFVRNNDKIVIYENEKK